MTGGDIAGIAVLGAGAIGLGGLLVHRRSRSVAS
jgi:MYXO-CTERM domain-containing protein